jgi:hypothetical protein
LSFRPVSAAPRAAYNKIVIAKHQLVPSAIRNWPSKLWPPSLTPFPKARPSNASPPAQSLLFQPCGPRTLSNSFLHNHLPTLGRSCSSFLHSRLVFSTVCGLFDKKSRGGIPLRVILSCAEAQKCPPVSPLPATLTHSLSRKSFACHSYANTRDRGATPLLIFAFHEHVLFAPVLSSQKRTNLFSRNSFSFTSIQIPQGCTPPMVEP